NIRRLQNFAYTEYFLFDIDHISEKGLDLNTLKNELKKNENVLLCFVSPSEDGLKVLFQLSDRCYDASLYSIFYKTYLRIFSSQYHLEQVIDKATSDVTRACFISYDREAYFNPDAKPVDLNKYIDQENTFEILQLKKKYELREKEENKEQKNSQETQQKEDVPDEIVDKIKTILKLSTSRKKEPTIFVPEELNRIMNALLDYLMNVGIVIKEVRNINYGKKVKAFVGNKEAEINIFYGKRGFSVVQSPRTGTSPEMNQLLAELIENFLQSV
ncbi:MAG TPA: CRISPR-associated primase-polymerase type B, partial [Paludibacteraceae bacterium]|nr:CRISPR-associated primase-polymerase type B [Paludibacteraceae bacterium]